MNTPVGGGGQQPPEGVVGGEGKVLLSIPQFLQHNQGRTSSEFDDSDPTAEVSNPQQPFQGDESIGEADDGKSGKLTLGILLAEQLIEPGDGVLSIDYLGQSFKGDLLPVGKIRSVETGLVFNNPSAWAIYCKKIINPAKKSGCGWASIKYKGRKMDYFKNIWMKRKAEREADTAKNEAAQALTALSAAFGQKQAESATVAVTAAAVTMPSTTIQPATTLIPTIPIEEPEVEIIPLDPGHKPTVKHTQISQVLSAPQDYHVDLESFHVSGRMQPFTVSVSTSAILTLDLHSHMAAEDVCGYLAGFWDPASHNLAITNSFPCLIDKDKLGTEEARRVESEIYDQLYGEHLSLVGWYHSSPKGPSVPTVKDCFDQLDFQIKLLGNGNDTYTPCVGLICSPYDAIAKSLESSIVVYWIYPPSESNSQDYGRPMRMSYSAISDPCLSSEVLQLIDKITLFYKDRTSSAVDFGSKYSKDLTYIQKLGKSLLSKFPQDQDEQLWGYIRTQIMGPDHVEDLPPPAQEEKMEAENASDDKKPALTIEKVVKKDKEYLGGDLLMKVGDTALKGVAAPPPPREEGGHHSEEEEIDDDEDNALQEEQEIDDDEENAIAAVSRSFPISTGTYSPLSYSQVISTSPPRVGNNGELDLRISGSSTAQTITMYSHHESELSKGKEKSKPSSGATAAVSPSQGLNVAASGIKLTASTSGPQHLLPANPKSNPVVGFPSQTFALSPAVTVTTQGKPGFLGVVPMSLNSGTTTLGPRTDILPVPPAALVARPGTEILQVPPAALVARPVTDILPVPSSADLAAAAATSSRPGIPVTAFTAVQVSVPIVATSLPDQPAEAPLNFSGKEDAAAAAAAEEEESDNEDQPLVIKE